MEVLPRASLLIESMRDIGYTLETALSDIVDNSIAAGAQSVEILVEPDAGNPAIAIMDNGRGMSASELVAAMRAGSQSPLAERSRSDLGRFGLGLKTASFSQCRRLTVLTCRSGARSCAVWDLDHVAATDRWEVRLIDDHVTVPFADRLPSDGTLVVWEHLDRIVGDVPRDHVQNVLAHRVDEAAAHIELVFHRYLSGEATGKRLPILLNGRSLAARDPFGLGHRSTQRDPEEVCRIKGHAVVVQAFTLPHHSRLKEREYEELAGSAGFLRNQGFYLYREKRLIIWGTWFGLARQRPITQLTRVRIDMPKELDADWKIDVKKASAQPPPALRAHLRALVDRICSGSKRVYTHRGKRMDQDSALRVWQRIQDKGKIRYGLNADHPMLQQLENELSDGGRRRLRSLLRLMESALPVDAIFADKGGDAAAVVQGQIESDDLRLLASDTYRHLARGGEARDQQILEIMQVIPDFSSRWAEVEAVLAADFGWN